MTKVILTRVLLGIQLIGLCPLLINSYRTNDQLQSLLNPQIIRTAVQKSIAVTLGISLAGFSAAMVAHYFSKNVVSICISVICTIYMFFPGFFPLSQLIYSCLSL